MLASSSLTKCIKFRYLQNLFTDSTRMFSGIIVLKKYKARDIKNNQNLSLSYNNIRNTTQSFGTKTFKPSGGKIANTKKTAIVKIIDSLSQHGRVFLDQIYAVLHSDTTNLTEDQAILLLQCCGNLLADQVPEVRTGICQHVWDEMKKASIPLNYETYISVCTENMYPINYKQILSEVKNVDAKLYKLILENVCQLGKTETAFEILEEMKNKDFPADEETFNCLLLAHAIKGGLKEAKDVLEIMKTAHVSPSEATRVMLLKGLSYRKNKDEFLTALELLPASLTEKSFLQIVKVLSENDNEEWLEHVLKKIEYKNISKQNLKLLDNICIQLIYLEKPLTAIKTYTQLVEHSPTLIEGSYGIFLLKEMLKKGVSPADILKAAQHLKELNLNPLAQEKITEIALRYGYSDAAWELLQNMKELRPHYFWPLLIKEAKNSGEIGLFEAVKRIKNLGVQFDEMTLEFYVLHFCDLTDPVNLLYRLKSLGFMNKELITPMIKILLRHNETDHARKICEMFDAVSLEGKLILSPLSTAWIKTNTSDNIVRILQKVCETNSRNTDWTGEFLENVLNLCKRKSDFTHFLELLKKIQTKKLRISPISADNLTNVLKNKCNSAELNTKIEECIDNLLDVSFRTDEQLIPHPRDMNINQLECHYEELESKGMETRGVLRKLIQMHSRLGNFDRVKELFEVFKERGYAVSPGIKANILHNYILSKNLTDAVKMYEEIISMHPWFQLDTFKILDLVALMVSNDQTQNALNLLKRETHKQNMFVSPSIEHNCVDLLKAYKNEDEQKEMFNFLIDSKYCTIGNNVLEPLIGIHLQNNDLEKAVHSFLEIARNYKMTPLQIELLCVLVKFNKEEDIQKVLNTVAEIHGVNDAHIGIIVALAQKGLLKTVRKIILEIGGLSNENLEKICNKWIKEGQLSSLETLAKAIRPLPLNVVDRSMVYKAIMKVHSTKNDCESALLFWQNLDEDEDFSKHELEKELVTLMMRCKYTIPDGLKTKALLSS